MQRTIVAARSTLQTMTLEMLIVPNS